MTAMRFCSDCKETKPVAEFSFRNKKTGTLQNRCKLCHAEYRRQHYLKNRDKYIDMAKDWNDENRESMLNRGRMYILKYLLKHPCVDCGEADPIRLEFDHVRGEKVKAITEFINGGCKIEKLEAEIAKCEVRCINCHRIKTAIEADWSILHLLSERGIDYTTHRLREK